MTGEGKKTFWVGGTDFCSEGVWRWCAQETGLLLMDRRYMSFAATQPDNWNNVEHCGVLDFKSGRLADLDCDVDQRYFVCEVYSNLKLLVP